jgi:hypothetical protein
MGWLRADEQLVDRWNVQVADQTRVHAHPHARIAIEQGLAADFFRKVIPLLPVKTTRFSATLSRFRQTYQEGFWHKGDIARGEKVSGRTPSRQHFLTIMRASAKVVGVCAESAF